MIVFHTRRVRQILKEPGRLGVDVLFLALICAVVGLLVVISEQFGQPFQRTVSISLSFWSLPKYTMLSLSRGFAAYAISLLFTLIYGTVAAHNKRAELIMVPALDVLQSIPVLSFLPGLVLAMISLFPRSEIGLELACIIMIFTGQAWNMTFSFYGSLRSIPTPLREVARVHHLSRWREFKLLELPAAMIGLVWNSMMSMAGGWFFLATAEAFQLRGRDFRLPGIGSYMSEAINAGNGPAMVAACVAMLLMIVAVDQLFWRPIVVWSERFKLEETAEVDKAQSWLLNLLQHSHFWHAIGQAWNRRRELRRQRPAPARKPKTVRAKPTVLPRLVSWAFLIALALLSLYGAWTLQRLLRALPIVDHSRQLDWCHVLLAMLASLGRTTAAVALGAVWTLPVGILIGLSPRWSQRLQPFVQIAASFPAPMLFPLVTALLIVLHVPFTIGCTVLMLMGSQWYILFNVIAGAMAIPSELKEVGRVFHTPIYERWLRLYIPGVFPYLVTGLVTAAGGAWNATIVSEFVQVKDKSFVAFGLGSMISEAAGDNFPLLAAATVTMAITVVTLNHLVWKRLYRLAEGKFSLNG